VSRRKGETLSRRYRSNGYVLNNHQTPRPEPDNRPQKKCPDFSTGAFHSKHLISDQCETAPLAPNPVCERTNCGKNSARSFSAAADLSVIEKNQIPMNAITIENNAGYS